MIVEKKRSRAGEALMVLALMAASCGAARATSGPVSNVATATANAVFTKTGNVTVSVTAKPLLAGNIADGATVGGILVEGSTGQTVAYRWTPGTGVITNQDNAPKVIELTGKAGNKIVLMTFLLGGSFQKLDGGGPWLSTRDNANIMSLDIRAKGNQFLKPDTYTLSVDGAVWAS